MNRVASFLFAFVAAVLTGATLPGPAARAASLPIVPDGEFSDWSGAPISTDATGDAGDSGIDFVELYVANDDDRLFLRFDTTVEVQPDEQQRITIGIDTDNDAGTGYVFGGIGAELVWSLGERWGQVVFGGNQYPIQHPDIGLHVGPTVSATEFEIAIDRAAVPAAGQPLFPGDVVRVSIWDGVDGDVIDGGAAPYVFDSTSLPVSPVPFTRNDPGDVRIAAYNILNDDVFNGGAQGAAFDRIFDAIDPDVWVLSEVWRHDAQETAAQVETYLPSEPGESWNAVKLDSGNVVVTRFPILDSWAVHPGSRLTAVLLDPRPQLDSDLLVLANHWSCCTADVPRQEQADAMIAFLRDARTPGGVLDLAPETPIVSAGDFNLVGWRAQLETALTGNISDNATFGPDSPPDWDGSTFDAARPSHPDARLAGTWWDDASSFYPGKLDWIFYTGSVLELQNRFVVETRSMTAASLSATGLDATDTPTASDHAPIVADFAAPPRPSDTLPPAAEFGFRLQSPAPNPFEDASTIEWALPRAGDARLTVHDVAGRTVRVLEDGAFEAGPQRSTWDGRDQDGASVVAGVYFVRLEWAGTQVRGRRVIRAR